MMKKVVSMLFLLCSSSVANAVFIDNGTYITDTESGHDWLKLTKTNTLSYNQVLSSGLLSEWSYVDDVLNLSLDDFQINEIPAFLELYGDLQFPEINDKAQSYAITGYQEFDFGDGFVDWQLNRVRIEADLDPDNPEIQIVDETLLFPNLDAVELFTGHSLVRVSAVPIPAAAWLFGSGLIGLLGIAIRRKAA